MIASETVCKVRGTTLYYHVLRLDNLDIIRAMILEQGEPVVNVHTERKIKRKRKTGGTVAITTETGE